MTLLSSSKIVHPLVVVFGLAGVVAGCGRSARDIEPAGEPVKRPPPPPDARGEPDAPVVIDAPEAPAMIEAPMAWSDRRAALTLAYRRTHSDPRAGDLEIEPRVVVLHYTAGNSAKGTLAYFDHVELEAGRPELHRGGRVNVSAHFVVDRDGTIYRAQPETRFARHCIGLNHIAIGIENVGDEKRWPLTDAQVAADVALVRYLAGRYPITHLLGHHEAMRFRAHPYYVERDPTYTNDKPDPGARFMAAVRRELADLHLAGL